MYVRDAENFFFFFLREILRVIFFEVSECVGEFKCGVFDVI